MVRIVPAHLVSFLNSFYGLTHHPVHFGSRPTESVKMVMTHLKPQRLLMPGFLFFLGGRILLISPTASKLVHISLDELEVIS